MVGIELHKNNGRLFRADQNNGDDFGLPSSGGSAGGGGSTPRPAGMAKKPLPPPNKKSSAPAIIIIIIVILIVAFLGYWFFLRKPPVKKQVVVAKPDTTAVQAPDTIVNKPAEVENVPVSTNGQIDTIVSRTGRYYVVISASIDDDLAMDYAKKLSSQGVSCKVLGSSDKKGYHQLSVADFDNRQDALARADELKGSYGDNIWVMKY